MNHPKNPRHQYRDSRYAADSPFTRPRAGILTVLGIAISSAALSSCAFQPSKSAQLPPIVHPATTEHQQVRNGHELFYSLCASCHGVSAHGDGPLAAELRGTPADLTLIAARRGGSFLDREIEEIIDGRREIRAHGSGEMPIWGRYFVRTIAGDPDEILIRARIASIVQYLRTIQTPTQPQ